MCTFCSVRAFARFSRSWGTCVITFEVRPCFIILGKAVERWTLPRPPLAPRTGMSFDRPVGKEQGRQHMRRCLKEMFKHVCDLATQTRTAADATRDRCIWPVRHDAVFPRLADDVAVLFSISSFHGNMALTSHGISDLVYLFPPAVKLLSSGRDYGAWWRRVGEP